MIGLYWMVIPVMLLHFYANLPMAQYNQLRSWIVTILTWIWSIRMIHSYFRRENWQLGVKQDWRYTDMSNQYGKNWWWISFFAIYLSQQVLQMGICLPLYIVHSVDKPLIFLDFVAIAICLSGVTIAFYADTELHNFITKNQKLQQLGQPMVPILDKGLWCYSRHPNYLGEQLWWWGLALFGWNLGQNWIFIGALINSICLGYVTMLVEKKMEIMEVKECPFGKLFLPSPSLVARGSSAGKGLGQSPSGRRFEPQQGHWRHYKPAVSPGPRGTNRGGPALKQRDPSSGKSSVLESVVGRDFLPRGSGIVTRRPLVLQLHKTDGGAEYAEFLHAPKKKFPEFAAVRQEIADETDRITGKSKQISNVPIHLSIFSPNVVDLTLIDLPGLTKVAVEGQPDSIVEDIEMMVRSYVEKPNCIILAISPANQDIATSDAIKLAREVDPSGERTFGVITKLDLMDQGTNALDVLEGRSYKLQHPWVGVVNRSQADINKSVDMMAARRKELEYFESSPEYGHLAHKMGAEYLAKLLSKHLETVIRQRIPSIIALINKTIDELNAELDRIGRPVGVDGGAQLYTILEMCRAFDRIFREHLEGGRPGGDRIYGVFDHQLPAALKKLPFDRHLSTSNVKKVISEADGYQPHLIAPEQGYRRLIDGSLGFFKGPAEASVDAVHVILKELVRKSLAETQELKRFPSLQSDIAAAANDALDRFRDESRKTVSRLVEMESSYLTVEFFRKLQTEPEKLPANQTQAQEKAQAQAASNVDREARKSLLNHFYSQIGRREKEELGKMLDEDPALMGKRETIAKRLELYKSARDEIDAVAWK
ncbi:hypothetical protein MTR67_000048 [Solanum verrucosum]|uniref:Dynamin-type G domain-containing protein n=1 Tax=Solanum verrucosum TaxID=315347 RepID=A0AAF0PKV6_SOLVR|nr:hypothetical protein MTR67_000048 [Solanum verrucosum]